MSEPLVLDFGKLLQDAKAGSAWPKGDYDMEVTEADSVHSKDGVPMVKAKLRCLLGSYAGKTMINNFVLKHDSPGALAMFFKSMRALGLDDASVVQMMGQINAADPNCLAPLANALRGRRARFTNDHRMWNGVAQNNITGVNPITDGIGAAGPIGSPTPAGVAPSVPAPPNLVAVPNPPAAPSVPTPGLGGAPVPPAPGYSQPAPAPAPVPPQPGPPPAPQPTPAPAPIPPASPQPAAPPVQQPAAPQDVAPAGFEAIWVTLSPEQKQGILASLAAQQQVVPQAAAAVPAPPAMPV